MFWVSEEQLVKDFIKQCRVRGRFWVEGNQLYLDSEALTMPWYLLFEHSERVANTTRVSEGGFFIVTFTAQLLDKADVIFSAIPSLVEQLQQDDVVVQQRNANALGISFAESLREFFIKGRKAAAENPRLAIRCIAYIKQLRQTPSTIDAELCYEIAHFVIGCVRLIKLSPDPRDLLIELSVSLEEIVPSLLDDRVVTDANLNVSLWIKRAELEYLAAIRDIAIAKNTEDDNDFAITKNEQLHIELCHFNHLKERASLDWPRLTYLLFDAERNYVADNITGLFISTNSVLRLLIDMDIDKAYRYIDLDLKYLLERVRNFVDLVASDDSYDRYLAMAPYFYVSLQQILLRYDNAGLIDKLVPFIKTVLPNMLLVKYVHNGQVDIKANLMQLLRKVIMTENGKDFAIEIPFDSNGLSYKKANWLHIILLAKHIEIIGSSLSLLKEQNLFEYFFNKSCVINDADETSLLMVDYIQKLSQHHEPELFRALIGILIDFLLPYKRYWVSISELIKKIDLAEFKAYVTTTLYAHALEHKIFQLLEPIATHCELDKDQLAGLCVLALQENLIEKARYFFKKLSPLLPDRGEGRRYVPQVLADYMGKEYQGEWPFKHFIEPQSGELITEKQLLGFSSVVQLIKYGFEMKISTDRRQLEVRKVGKTFMIVQLPEELSALKKLDASIIRWKLQEVYARSFHERYEAALQHYYDFKSVKIALLNLIELAAQQGILKHTLRGRLNNMETYLFNLSKSLHDVMEGEQSSCLVDCNETNEQQLCALMAQASDCEVIYDYLKEFIKQLMQLDAHVSSFDRSVSYVEKFIKEVLPAGWNIIKDFLKFYLARVEIALGSSQCATNVVTTANVVDVMQDVIKQYHQLCGQEVIIEKSYVDKSDAFPIFVPSSRVKPTPESILFCGASLFAERSGRDVNNVPDSGSECGQGVVSRAPL